MVSQFDDGQGFCMTGGTGETSYATNSFLQKNVIQKVEAVLKEGLERVCLSLKDGERLTVADLGCSSGPNALDFVQSVVDVAALSCGQGVELNAYMNDLPQNDFNTIFKMLPGFYKKMKEEKGEEMKCFISGTPGSFYGRLFPSNFLHFVHSSYTLHWRSKVPQVLDGNNKGCIYARQGSPAQVLKAYNDQFDEDFTIFLNCRSKEIIYGGGMLLTIVATHDHESSVAMESLTKALYNLASKGVIEKEKLDAFNLAYHRPAMKQVKQVIEEEGSFSIQKLSAFTMPWSVGSEQEEEDDGDDAVKTAKFMGKSLRGGMESILIATFGEHLIDQITNEFEHVAALEFFSTDHKAGPFQLAISMLKI